MTNPDPLRGRVAAAVGDQYELTAEMGRGGMAVVYRARDRRLHRDVAIKVLPPELAYDPAILLRFTQEAQTAAQLSHAHIVPIFDVGEREGIAYFVMAFVGGGSLAALLTREPRQSPAEVRRILREIADALDYAHARGVIHRDIKPDNILLDAHTGRVMVSDFGIARALESGTRLTITGNTVGTPAYMSPEQAMGEREVDARSDIYALGVIGYQMLTGRPPFTASNSMALLLKQVGEQPKPIAELRHDAPRALSQVIERALLKAAEERWPSAGALRDALSAESIPGSSSWRNEQRDPVRYTSPRPPSALPQRPPASEAPLPRSPGEVVLEPEHLASLTPEQRFDLRIWHGRINLLERVKTARGYAVLTLAVAISTAVAVVAGLSEEFVPVIFAPVVPWYMIRKLVNRAKSLRASRLKLRRVFLMPRAKWVIPGPPPAPPTPDLHKLASPHTLEGPYGGVIRRAVADRAAILEIVRSLSPDDRALLPDVEPTANALVDRVAHLAEALRALEEMVDEREIRDLDRRIAEADRSAGGSPDAQRRVELLRRQRTALDDLLQRREVFAAQLSNAGVSLSNLRLDLIKLRWSGVQSALSEVTSATQQARALTRDIGTALEVADELKQI